MTVNKKTPKIARISGVWVLIVEAT